MKKKKKFMALKNVHILRTDPGTKSEISVRELISSLKKKKKKAQARN